MPNLEQVAVTIAPAGAKDDTVADGANRSTRCGGVVGALMLFPDAEDRMEASAKGAGDSPELERSTQEGSAERLAIGIEKIAADGVTRVPDGLQLGTGEGERGGENLSDAHRAARRGIALGHDTERVAGLQVATHIDLVVEYVGERPGQLLARAGRKQRLRAGVHRLVERGGNGAAHDNRIGGPGEPLFGLRP